MLTVASIDLYHLYDLPSTINATIYDTPECDLTLFHLVLSYIQRKIETTTTTICISDRIMSTHMYGVLLLLSLIFRISRPHQCATVAL